MDQAYAIHQGCSCLRMGARWDKMGNRTHGEGASRQNPSFHAMLVTGKLRPQFETGSVWRQTSR